jgi:S1-C subfamily serine protease
LSKIINKYNAGDRVSLKILRSGEEKMLEAVLGERSE